jgi:hypothetical protein
MFDVLWNSGVRTTLNLQSLKDLFIKKNEPLWYISLQRLKCKQIKMGWTHKVILQSRLLALTQNGIFNAVESQKKL